MTANNKDALPRALSETALSNAFLGNVIEICIVTADHQRTMEGLVRLGIGPWRVYTFSPENTEDMRYRGEPAEFTIKVCFARCGNVIWELMQPLSGPTIFGEFLQKHGEGVQHIAFDCGDIPLDDRLREFKKRGFVPVQSGNWMGKNRFVFFGTDDATGAVFETIHFPLDFEYPEPEQWFPGPPPEVDSKVYDSGGAPAVGNSERPQTASLPQEQMRFAVADERETSRSRRLRPMNRRLKKPHVLRQTCPSKLAPWNDLFGPKTRFCDDKKADDT